MYYCVNSEVGLEWRCTGISSRWNGLKIRVWKVGFGFQIPGFAFAFVSFLEFVCIVSFLGF